MTKYVKCSTQKLDEIIEHYSEKACWFSADGNIVGKNYCEGLVEGLRRVKRGEYE